MQVYFSSPSIRSIACIHLRRGSITGVWKTLDQVWYRQHFLFAALHLVWEKSHTSSEPKPAATRCGTAKKLTLLTKLWSVPAPLSEIFLGMIYCKEIVLKHN